MDFHLKRMGEVEMEEQDGSTREYEDEGKKLKAHERKEKQDTETIDLLYLLSLFPPGVEHKAHTRKD